MKLSTRVRYGVRAMIELALSSDGKPVPLRKLAENQTISTKYLEQIATALKVGELIESVRGAEGGYRLARPAEEITIYDIYTVLDVAVDVINCQLEDATEKKPCPRDGHCVTQELWVELNQKLISFLKTRNLKELAERQQLLNQKAKASG